MLSSKILKNSYKKIASTHKAKVINYLPTADKEVDQHHKIEGSFKAVSRALRAAVEIDPRRGGTIPSTKNVI